MTSSTRSLILLFATLAGCTRPVSDQCFGPSCEPPPYFPPPDMAPPTPDQPDLGPTPDMPPLVDPFGNIPSGLVTAKPNSYDFGTVSVGAVATTTFDLTITDVYPDMIDHWLILDEKLQPSDQLGVSVTGCSSWLHFGDHCTATVTYAPTRPGPVKALFEVIGLGSNSGTVYPFAVARLYGNGLAASTTLSADRTSFDFGDRQIGSSGTVSLGFHNSGQSPTTPIMVAASGDGFSIISDSCSGMHLPPSGFCSVELQFSPTAIKDYSDDVTVSAADVATPMKVHVTGHGADPAALQVAAPAIASQFLDVTSPEATAHVSNSGSEATGALQVKLAGTDAAAFKITSDGCGGKSIAGKDGCDVKVTFTPTERRTYAASIVVSGMPGGSATADLSGRGLVHSTLVGQNVFWGTVSDGSSANVVFTNRGDDNTGTLTAVLAPASGPYSVTSDRCSGNVLGPNLSCAVTVQFAPQIVGTYDAAVTVSGAAAGAATGTLDATFASTTQLRVSPASLEFGSAVYPSSAQTLHLWNVGPGDLTLATFIQTVPFAVSPSSNIKIAAGARVDLLVTFTPPASAEYSDNLQLLLPSGSSIATVPLHGIGVWPAFDFTPQPLDFGPITIGHASDPATVTVHNRSNRAWPTTYSIDDDDFTFVSTTCPATLVPNDHCTFTLVFGPRSVGNKTGTLSFPDAEGQPGLSLLGSGK